MGGDTSHLKLPRGDYYRCSHKNLQTKIQDLMRQFADKNKICNDLACVERQCIEHRKQTKKAL